MPIFPGLAHVAITVGDRDLLIRRSPGTGKLAYLRCYSPHRVPLSALGRWPVNAGASRYECEHRTIDVPTLT